MLTTDSKDLELGYGVDKEPREQMKKHQPSNCSFRDKDQYTFGCSECMPLISKINEEFVEKGAELEHNTPPPKAIKMEENMSMTNYE